ncbi:glucose-1-phosphate cytidylyltransferase [Roseomonas sp. NAR14]|uniref:Glucose-1-phosphate cytidylyltransferase n=1 Tax=Roseomonas acroporae TaxID=2937791 RepID=A0A9X1YAK6_9PROT|nr:glucose-1-phosphate cytidylyltransferase [Roseomonas acroporae]MCK8786202.1 glucose-1-phosphate cytidylyltransferase [Roseomonas acroporae]
MSNVPRRAVIFAGGYGTRLMEETEARPKPMVEIGGRPILWHIMKIYAASGITEFVIPLGYKAHMIKQYFADYYLHASDVSIDMVDNRVTTLRKTAEPWKITLIDTGIDTMTGGRLKRLQPYLNDEPFALTYGDGVIDLDLGKVADMHASSGRYATLTAVRPPSRFGTLTIDDGQVLEFAEKPLGGEAWINGGFFMLSPRVFDYLDGGDEMVFERGPLERLARDGQLQAYQHEGFWYSMDTLRDKKHLEELWMSGRAPWKRW